MQDNVAWERRLQALKRRAHEFGATYRRALEVPLPPPDGSAPRALFISGAPPRTEIELCLMKALSVAGWNPIPIIMMQPDVLKAYYKLLGPSAIYEWSDYLPDSAMFTERAGAAVASCYTLEDLQALQIGGVRVGGHAISSARRHLRIGGIDFGSHEIRARLAIHLANSMAAAQAAACVIAATSPKLVLAVDTVYTPKGEILDTALAFGIPFIRWFPGHRNNTLMLKRYTAANRDSDLNSLSEPSWQFVKAMAWKDAYAQEVDDELFASYSAGDWYGETATQFERPVVDAARVRSALGIDGSKKVAVIFAHIAWDASFGRGRDLFNDYEEWLVETVRAACANTQLQWLIKIHPAHVGKNAIDFEAVEPSEVRILRERIGTLPEHVKLIPADFKVSTYSIFPLMDWALTVRGTAGLEAARSGIPVLTGGTGRYDRRGFTIDSDTREDYLAKVARLHEIAPLSADQTELANRYAFALFRLRPLPLSTVTLEYDKKYGVDAFYSGVRIRNRTLADWLEASDLNAFADWATWSEAEDFLLPPPRAAKEIRGLPKRFNGHARGMARRWADLKTRLSAAHTAQRN
ncbi:hypothetical protein [Hyphomicrobium sp.]|uniref:hypothetical protein n=1 Tax=Hyphomicrobium sp. TaxID=82 RepID=UPI002D77A531|nr:hypothetical protein [Hyphomicrobium sp.]HET6388693.1 hypothetical protein [Hyphomicrobium sp.]